MKQLIFFSGRAIINRFLTGVGSIIIDDDVTNQSLEKLFYPGRNKDNEERLMPDYPKIHRELAKKGVTLTLLWTEYCLEASAAGKKPYMSTQFNDNYHKWARITKATMRIVFSNFQTDVNTDELVHTARSSSACFPVFQCTLSAA